MISPQDTATMRQALALAEKGRGRTAPNPLVGAVLVKNGKIIARGYHARCGGPHAEAEVLRKAGKKARGAVLYVTLSPCASFGKTPPCAAAIIAAGIKEVCIALPDPNPAQKAALQALRKAGIKIRAGILRQEARAQNEIFCKWISNGKPFVTLKIAETLDGKIATAKGNSRWITGPQARRRVHFLRAEHQAVLVGKNTVLKDNPYLNVREPGLPQPWRIVLDQRLEIPLTRKVFKQTDQKTLVVCGLPAFKKKYRQYDQRGIGLLAVAETKTGLDLSALLNKLAAMNITSLLVEGGGETVASFLRARLVDKVLFFIAPKIMGGRQAISSVGGAGIENLDKTVKISRARVEKIGEDFLFTGYPVYS